MRVLRYSVGNENDPGDPWGRSHLIIRHNGDARLDHYFSRVGTIGAWIGQVEATALDALWSALKRAGFPAVPTAAQMAAAALRRIVVESDGVSEQAMVGYHQAALLPGYAEAFDILDAIIRQLSRNTVTYPTNQPSIVRDAAEAPSTPSTLRPHSTA